MEDGSEWSCPELSSSIITIAVYCPSFASHSFFLASKFSFRTSEDWTYYRPLVITNSAAHK